MSAPGILAARILGDHRHGFTTREGGASRGAFASLNLSTTVGDDVERVRENWERLRAVTGLDFARVRPGPRLPRGRGRGRDRAGRGGRRGGHRRARRGRLRLGGRLRAGARSPIPGAARWPRSHAGWRGTIDGAAAAGVKALVERHGADPDEMLAAIGPGIGPCCFEVSRDLAARFRDEVGPVTATSRDQGSRVDLWRANELLLRKAGLARRRIETLGTVHLVRGEDLLLPPTRSGVDGEARRLHFHRFLTAMDRRPRILEDLSSTSASAAAAALLLVRVRDRRGPGPGRRLLAPRRGPHAPAGERGPGEAGRVDGEPRST